MKISKKLKQTPDVSKKNSIQTLFCVIFQSTIKYVYVIRRFYRYYLIFFLPPLCKQNINKYLLHNNIKRSQQKKVKKVISD